jgi:hypothetical protein
VTFAVFRWDGVTGRLEKDPAGDGYNHAQEDHRCGVVRDDFVEMAGHSRCRRRAEILIRTKDQYFEGAGGQDDEAGKDQNVEGSRTPVPRVFPLPEPELQNLLQPQQGPVKAKVRCAMEERHQTLAYNEGKAGYTQKVNCQKKYCPRS